MRVFFAIDVDREVRDRVEALRRELGASVPKARFVSAEKLHLTLRFLGEATREQAEAISTALSRTTAASPGFTLEFRGLGVFPTPGKARVLWVGTNEVPAALVSLQSEIERVVRGEGFEPDGSAFHPHLTVARFRRPPREIAAILKRAEDRDFGSTTVTGFVFYESVTSSARAAYQVLRSFPLAPIPAGS